MTHEQKTAVLKAYGFTVGARDARLNTDHPGNLMVLEGSIQEAEQDHDLPTANGCDGPWCVVGDSLPELVDEAFDLASSFSYFEEICKDVLAGGDGILHVDGTGAGPRVT